MSVVTTSVRFLRMRNRPGQPTESVVVDRKAKIKLSESGLDGPRFYADQKRRQLRRNAAECSVHGCRIVALSMLCCFPFDADAICWQFKAIKWHYDAFSEG